MKSFKLTRLSTIILIVVLSMSAVASVMASVDNALSIAGQSGQLEDGDFVTVGELVTITLTVENTETLRWAVPQNLGQIEIIGLDFASKRCSSVNEGFYCLPMLNVPARVVTVTGIISGPVEVIADFTVAATVVHTHSVQLLVRTEHFTYLPLVIKDDMIKVKKNW